MISPLPVGKVPQELLAAILARAPIHDPRVILGPGIGLDCAVVDAGRVTAMHDPTEGGIVTALWELAEASQRMLLVDPVNILVPALARRVCEAFGIDPLASIASGSLLITAPASDARAICDAGERGHRLRRHRRCGGWACHRRAKNGSGF